ncbi:MAG TPA: AlkA N-terminal domain-containing protein [Amnibacterium sp.]|nr:AlkA N-terminal domain-containing protein [Amnibacterium sp.]
MHRVRLELPFTPPLEPSNLYGHLAATAVPGVEEWRDGAYRAAVRLAGGPAIVAVRLPVGAVVPVELLLTDAADLEDAVARVRRLLDLDLEPDAASAVLAADPVLAPLVAAVPGRRVPGTLDPPAMALRAVLGQQIATAAARTITGRLVAALGEPIADPDGGLAALFPAPAALVADIARAGEVLRMPDARRRTVLAVAAALARGALDLAADPPAVRAALLEVPGVGPWTADTVRMRALGDADAFLAGDLGVVLAARRLGLPARPGPLERHSRAWSPYRAHAVQYLWATGEHAVNTLPR